MHTKKSNLISSTKFCRTSTLLCLKPRANLRTRGRHTERLQNVPFTRLYSMCPTVPSTEGASDAAARRPDTVNSKYARGARERTCTRTAPRLHSAPIPRRGKIYIEFNEFRDRIVLIKKGNGFSAICIRYSISLHSTPSPTIKPPLPSSFFFFFFAIFRVLLASSTKRIKRSRCSVRFVSAPSQKLSSRLSLASP